MNSDAQSPDAGSPPLDLNSLLAAYYDLGPDPENPDQGVSFGTSGHRGSSLHGSFNEAHILAITQAVCDYRASQGIAGPLFMGKDTHALSGPAHETALEVMAARGVEVRIQAGGLPTPTPVISNAILGHNAKGQGGVADGIVITPSHNPPEDGGFKYNESHGGPAGTEVTAWIQERANAYLASGNRDVRRLGQKAAKAPCVKEIDYIMPYARGLEQTINMRAIASSGLRLGADPLGGSALPFWEPIADLYKLNLTVVNKELDPLFSFMPKDHDGKIRMDCSSPQAMAGLIRHAGDYDIAFGNDPDADRHGIVTPRGLMNPNHYLCAAVAFLLQHRPRWPRGAAVGKTCVTSSMMNRVCAAFERALYETPVGFKWFVRGLLSGDLLFGGEESAGASFLRLDGRPWSTDKDGIIMNLLAAEITADLGKNPAELYEELTERFGAPHYARLDAPASAEEKRAFKKLSPAAVTRKSLAGDPITGIFTNAPGNQEAIGGLKVETDRGWFAARPSGTEDIYKIYAESFVSAEHLAQLQTEAKELVSALFAAKAQE
ncbi:phosphoglucomutase (alpha-D-glucose-1,6-bisphosphate-dependent) [Desulfovibrio sp. OttesenSCG-928-G11]|nr:phosphoglucomutase (alpha-D-glucose-1,6-bisphosphate-dependent) [Desulfovibrio sp. OttesenSCG-928-G11]